jgi:hypothetical protein
MASWYNRNFSEEFNRNKGQQVGSALYHSSKSTTPSACTSFTEEKKPIFLQNCDTFPLLNSHSQEMLL